MGEILKMQHTPAPKKVDHMLEILKMAHVPPPAENSDHKHAQQIPHMCNKSNRDMPIQTPLPLSEQDGKERAAAKGDLFFAMLDRTFRFFSKNSAEMSSEDVEVQRKLKAGYAKRRRHAKDAFRMQATFPLISS